MVEWNSKILLKSAFKLIQDFLIYNSKKVQLWWLCLCAWTPGSNHRKYVTCPKVSFYVSPSSFLFSNFTLTFVKYVFCAFSVVLDCLYYLPKKFGHYKSNKKRFALQDVSWLAKKQPRRSKILNRGNFLILNDKAMSPKFIFYITIPWQHPYLFYLSLYINKHFLSSGFWSICSLWPKHKKRSYHLFSNSPCLLIKYCTLSVGYQIQRVQGSPEIFASDPIVFSHKEHKTVTNFSSQMN